MLRRNETRCTVQSCPFNRGERGTLCDYRLRGKPCRHPTYRGTWAAAHELERALEANGAPVPIPAQPAWGLTSRAMVANTTMDADRARQLAMEFEEVSDG